MCLCVYFASGLPNPGHNPPIHNPPNIILRTKSLRKTGNFVLGIMFGALCPGDIVCFSVCLRLKGVIVTDRIWLMAV